MVIDRLKQLQDSMGKHNLIADLFPGANSHYLGISKENEVVLFINTQNPEKVAYGNSDGRFLSVSYNIDCEFIELESNILLKKEFSVIRLKNCDFEDSLLVKLFLNLCSDLIADLGESPSPKEVFRYIENLKKLFSKLIVKTNTTELGLWGELFVISESKDPEYMIHSWHLNKNDKFDFNDGVGKLEVKTTLKSNRKHHFSLEQLTDLANENTLVCSIMTSEITLGASIYDLYEIIISKLINNKHAIEEFSDKLFEVGGANLESFNKRFDMNTAKIQLRYFQPSDIPSVDLKCIKAELSEVKFVSNLEHIPFVNIEKYSKIKLFSNLS